MRRETRMLVQKPGCAGCFGRAGMLGAGLLILTACGSGQPADTASPTVGITTPAEASSMAPVAEPPTQSAKVFRDQELMAISSKRP